MAAVLARPSIASTRSSSAPSHALHLNTSIRGTPAAVPNKHLPVCSPGPRPEQSLSPATPALLSTFTSTPETTSSLLHPPSAYKKLSSDPPVYAINAEQLHAAVDHIAAQPLPDPKLVFPWLHGLHAENGLQLAFFLARKRTSRRQPRCFRGLTIVKMGGDLTTSRLKGAVTPEELLNAAKCHAGSPQFLSIDPKDGFSVRNFQIQAAKLAIISDIVVYGADESSKQDVHDMADLFARAQKACREKECDTGNDYPLFSTFVLTDAFAEIERDHPEIVAVDSSGHLNSDVLDFFHSERVEMQTMSKASQIAPNVWLGPSPDLDCSGSPASQQDRPLPYDVMIECSDMAQSPTPKSFTLLDELLNSAMVTRSQVPQLEFPGSGSIMPPTWAHSEVDSLIRTVSWIHNRANGLADDSVPGVEAVRKRKDSKVSFPSLDPDGDSSMGDDGMAQPRTTRKFLLHCSDGYTETTLLAVAYYMFANCVPLHQAYIEMHCEHKRNFFAYPTDISLLTTIQPRILQASPKARTASFSDLSPPAPSWMTKVDGSLPSRVMPYMYLGNLNHANNPGLLQKLGIGQVLSIGESVDWTDVDKTAFCQEGQNETMPFEWCPTSRSGKWLYVGGVQDNGVDPLTNEFERCLDFIAKGRRAGIATLVHCRVGVSRSATICIAEVMNELGYSFPQAYCFVRARRLNVIIQPHLRFSYELLKYEETQAARRGVPFKRHLEWATIAREIAAMNRPYSRQ